MIGEVGLTTAMHEIGYVLTNRHAGLRGAGGDPHLQLRGHHHRDPPDQAGARFIATNPDPTGPSPAGDTAGSRFGRRPDLKATGKQPYFVGKPNPLMMRSALNRRGALRIDGDDR